VSRRGATMRYVFKLPVEFLIAALAIPAAA
jgi:hypothetical protein